MNREDGIKKLTERGWLSTTPTDFQRAMLSQCRWQQFEAGARIQVGDEEVGEMIGLVRGTIAMRTVLGASDTPMMHIEHPVCWFGYAPIIARRRRGVSVEAHSPIWLASVPQPIVLRVLDDRPEWWRHMLQLPLKYGDIAATIAADLLIRSTERRCAAVLLRFGGCRFAGPDDAAPVEVAITQDALAAAANLSRNTAGTVLRKLVKLGLVELGYRGVIVCQPMALRRFVDAT